MKMQTPQYYSQWGEDRILARVFAGVEAGTCIDVGAHDGIHFSNSYYFEQIGWRCILIEPAPKLCAAISKNRCAQLFPCAASDKEGEANLRWIEGADLYSTIREASRTSDSGREIEKEYIRIPTRRLDNILAEAGVERLEFVSIDVEGHEMAVLRGFSIGLWRPRIVIIEDNGNLTDISVLRVMRSYGYRRFYRTGVNDWYAAPSERKLRNLAFLLLSGKWGLKGLAKVWLPASVTRLITSLQLIRSRKRSRGEGK